MLASRIVRTTIFARRSRAWRRVLSGPKIGVLTPAKGLLTRAI
ncbi:hypothetical protein PPTG_08587 [Phytophthora nicotianae INRA-310]|uniref:Uncharacterized protein n=1 Tax=Phytophthora nicotianae (strain INRA-310) TaxID=761204 RepID=W2QLW8_PHYN3|nr:hypothetical protein PPTG_08587 [Phytophthora nicotianae INRA-310]ETN13906.1 hypothetical protein PPTG_08587 [Phytophthora nicotianae INRA-310]